MTDQLIVATKWALLPAMLVALSAPAVQADGLLDPLNVFSNWRSFRETYPPMVQRKPSETASQPHTSRVAKLSLPSFTWLTNPKQGSFTASLDRKFRTNWVTPKRMPTPGELGNRVGEAMANTADQVGKVTRASYEVTADALSPKENIRRAWNAVDIGATAHRRELASRPLE